MVDLSIIQILSIVILAFIVISVIRSVQIIPQGYNYTVERFGAYIKTLDPGFHLIIPITDRIGARVNMMEMVLDVPSQDVITKDNAAVHVDGVLFFQILDAAKSAYEVANLHQAILSLTMTNIRTVMGSMDLDELLSHREAINARLLGVVDEATGPWGTKVTRIEIKDIRPPRDLVESMARQMKAERDKRASILEAEGDRQSKILSAEGVRQSMILEAQGRMESAKLDAEARERLGEAEANVTKLVSEAASNGGKPALNYFVAQKYVEAFSQIAKSNNQKIIMMPMESSSLIGTLGGIAEVAKEAFKEIK
jgi:regulator of protease activity HflC (stomatin/prohibitin superfamily)